MIWGIPDYLFKDIYEITPEFFTEKGINFILCDVDNTLVTYDDELPTEGLLIWLERMNCAGIRFAFVSNNHPPRIEKFNSILGYPYICDAKKPLPFALKKILKKHNIKKENCAMLGDQILTDSMAGALLGIPTVNVAPIKDRTGAFFKFKRRIERILMKSYWKAHPEDPELYKFWHEKTGNKF